MKAIKLDDFHLKNYGTTTIQNLVKDSPHWGYKEGDTWYVLQFARFKIDSSTLYLRKRFDEIMGINYDGLYFSHNYSILNLRSIIYVDESMYNLYGHSNLIDQNHVWLTMPSKRIVEDAIENNDIGLKEEWLTNIITIMRQIERAKDVYETDKFNKISTKAIVNMYINLI